jgi:hypothetical protein
MKILFGAIRAVVLFVLLLRSEVTPWRIVRAEDLERPNQPTRVLIPVTRAAEPSGDWMRNPNYRTALEKTTVVGRPEQAAERDTNKPPPTPSPHR